MSGVDTSYTFHSHSYVQATVTGSAQTFAQLGAVVPSWATLAFVVPETGAVRYRADGTAPTASIGVPIATGQAWPIQGSPALQATQFISQSGGSVTMSIEFRG